MKYLYTVVDTDNYNLANDLTRKSLLISLEEYKKFVFDNKNILLKVNRLLKNPEKIFIIFFSKESIGDSLIELGLLVDVLRREFSCDIECFIPYLQYCRSNRLNDDMISLGAKVYATFLSSIPINKYIMFDLHAPELVGFFSKPVYQLSTISLFQRFFFQKNITFDYIVAPDCGRYDTCFKLANLLNAKVDFFTKIRTEHTGMSFISEDQKPNLCGKKILLLDDEVTSGQTLLNAIERLLNEKVEAIHIAIIYSFLKKSTLDKIIEIKAIKSFTTTNLGVPISKSDIHNLHLDYHIIDCSELLIKYILQH